MLISGALLVMLVMPPATAALNQFQGRMATRMNRCGARASPMGKMKPKTSDSTAIIRSGLTSDQKKPSTEFL